MLLLFICVWVIWKVSRKQMTEKEERAESGKVRQLFPDPDDPEYSIGKDNKPSWKPRKSQSN